MAFDLSGYHRTLDLFEGLVDRVPPGGWDAPSPCRGWTARDVAGHVTGGQHLIRALAAGEAAPDVNRAPSRFAPGDVAAAWREARARCAALLTPDALARPVPLGGLGDVALGAFLEGYILEPLVHAWDLARATGQPARLDADLVHHAFATARLLGSTLRAAGHLGPPLPAERGAGELTRLLAFLGRSTSNGHP